MDIARIQIGTTAARFVAIRRPFAGHMGHRPEWVSTMIITDETALILRLHRGQALSLGERIVGWLGAKPPARQGVSEAYLTGGALPWLAGAQADPGGWSVEIPEAHALPHSTARRAA